MFSGISIIICCYNSAGRLPATLKHLANQKISPAISWEVVLVDNNSTDQTIAVAAEEWRNYGLGIPLRVIPEPQQGLINARFAGVKNSAFDLLIFCDDDNWLDENYLALAYGTMCLHPNIGVLGGQSTGQFETQPPAWFDRYKKAYAVGKPMLSSGVANRRTYIAGAGMVVRKDIFQLLERLHYKPVLKGRCGSKLYSGEDSELSLVLLFLGYDIYYEAGLHFTHFIPVARLSWNYCVEMISSGHAIPHIYFSLYHYSFLRLKRNESPVFQKIYVKILAGEIKQLLKSMLPLSALLRLIFHTSAGSERLIKQRAAYNKILYLILRRKKIKSQFRLVCWNVSNIQLHQQKLKEALPIGYDC